MIYKFASQEELKNVTEFAKMINNIYDHSAVETIDRVAHKLEHSDGTIELSEDTHDNNDYNELICLYNIVKILNDVSAEHVDSAGNVYSVLKDYVVPSDVPRFLAMLKENDIDPGWCDSLFDDWVSGEGLGILAISCMEIQVKHHIDMTNVYSWLNTNEPIPGTNWKEEVAKYRKEVY